MIVVYVGLLLLLGLAGWLARARVGRLEKRYSRLAAEVDALARRPLHKQGNGRDPDLIESARRHYQLALLVQARDRLEARYETWQRRTERLFGWFKGLRHWRGRTAPYLVGAVDTVAGYLALDAFGLTETLRWTYLAQFLTGWFCG
jgi:hypothetical protein